MAGTAAKRRIAVACDLIESMIATLPWEAGRAAVAADLVMVAFHAPDR